MIYDWFTKDTERIVLDYIDTLYNVESHTNYNMINIKTIGFKMNDSFFTIIIKEDGSISHSKELVELDLKPFILQQIRDYRIQSILKNN
jgi:hypothetical protein